MQLRAPGGRADKVGHSGMGATARSGFSRSPGVQGRPFGIGFSFRNEILLFAI
jgi:hypothetical protein